MNPFDRASRVHENFLSELDACTTPDESAPLDDERVDSSVDLTWEDLIQVLHSQLASRQMDLVARELKEQGVGYYTIPSSGHEGNAAVAQALRTSDPGMVHYRSAAFMLQRRYQSSGSRALLDFMRSFTASSEDPVAAGRHKVFGDAETWIPPQTSTIASHLPRAAGMAFGIDLGARIGHEVPVPDDAITFCSFGDASVNHSVFQGTLNSVLWAVHQDLPVPLLFICEDNGFGISVRTPENWIESCVSGRPRLRYMSCNGWNPVNTYRTTCSAIEHVRTNRTPVFLHVKTVRLLGHSGADIEQEYRSSEEIEAAEANDPLIHTARTLITNNIRSPGEIRDTYLKYGEEIRKYGVQAAGEPGLSSSEAVMGPLHPRSTGAVEREAPRVADPQQRISFFGDRSKLPENRDQEISLARSLNLGLAELLVKYEDMLLFGEDVGRKGGVYNVTQGLQEKAGSDRVFDTMLDETTILGLALGLGTFDYLPVPEIQYLAYVYNAYDQLRGESTGLPFLSDGQFSNGMVVRIPSFASPEGAGAHFHNDHGIAALREIPGITIVVPARGDDAVRLLRTAMALAREAGQVVLFLEPTALYFENDLYREGDNKWRHAFPEPGSAISTGEARFYNTEEEPDVTILTYGNGVRLSLKAARTLHDEHHAVRVGDLRWLKPINTDLLKEEARKNEHIVIVDECRRNGGPGPQLATELHSAPSACNVELLTADDSFVPLGPAAEHVLITEETICGKLREMLENV